MDMKWTPIIDGDLSGIRTLGAKRRRRTCGG